MKRSVREEFIELCKIKGGAGGREVSCGAIMNERINAKTNGALVAGRGQHLAFALGPLPLLLAAAEEKTLATPRTS